MFRIKESSDELTSYHICWIVYLLLATSVCTLHGKFTEPRNLAEKCVIPSTSCCLMLWKVCLWTSLCRPFTATSLTWCSNCSSVAKLRVSDPNSWNNNRFTFGEQVILSSFPISARLVRSHISLYRPPGVDKQGPVFVCRILFNNRSVSFFVKDRTGALSLPFRSSLFSVWRFINCWISCT